MRSVYAKILLWCLGTLVLSLVAFVAISMTVSFRAAGRSGPFERLQALELEEARDAYVSGGPAQLSVYLRRVNRVMGAEHYVTDSAGKDLVTGEDRSPLLAEARAGWSFTHHLGGRLLIAATSRDHRYHLIVKVSPPISIWTFVPYYLLILLVVAFLCWLLAVNLASPLRQLARTVDRFGQGDLSARVHSRRRDEIGNLARAFDHMAERTETLLTAERRLLQDISHELRSPLARLSFAAELTKTAVDRNAAAARLKKEIDRLTSLVGALLQVTRVENDPSSSHLDEVPLDELVYDLAGDCQVEADARDCRIVVRTVSKVSVRGDAELLRRAVENVLRNAIRYAPEHTTIEVRLDAKDSCALVSVRDYGPGVPTESLAKIFSPFFRVDGSRDNATGGVGLGLAIAQRAVSVHGGQITARNAEPGLLVTIELPNAAVRHEPAAATV